MTTQLAPTPVFRGTDAFGLPLYLGQLGTFIAGTNTPQATYKDSAGIATNTNPVILNARGECNLWLDPAKSYKLVLSDALGNLIWSVDNVTIGNANPTYNIIPTVDNLFTLGSTSFAWANVYVGPNHEPILGASGIVGYYPRTAAEIALSVTPTDFSYPADPYVDPRRYGAVPGAEATTAVQTALNVAFKARSCLDLGGNTYLIGGGGVGLTLTVAGGDNDLVTGFHMRGSSVNGAILRRNGAITSVLTVSAAAPTGSPQDIPMLFENFTIDCNQPQLTNQTCDGITIINLSGWTLRKLQIYQGNRCCFINSGLTGLIDDCQFTRCTYGVYARTNGAGAPPNQIHIRNSALSGATLYAVDYDTGSELYVEGCDIEANGSVVAFTAGLAGGATSGTLTATWKPPSGVNLFTFSQANNITVTAGSTAATLGSNWTAASGLATFAFANGVTMNATPTNGSTAVTLAAAWPGATGATTFAEGRNVTVTNGSTAVSWTGGLNAAVTATVINSSGSIHIGGAINAAPGFGLARVTVRDCWIEEQGLNGGWAVLVDAPTASQITWFVMDGGHIVSATSGRALNVLGATHVSLRNTFSDTPGDTWNLNCSRAFLQDVVPSTLNDANVTYPTYVNVQGPVTQQPNGRVDNFTATLTGCTTSPTVNVAIHQQGDEITLDFLGAITATSNTTAATLTGLPAKYWPAADSIGQCEIQDNSANSSRPCQVAAATGVITLGFGQTLTAAGTKGLVGGQLRFRRA